MSKLVVSILSDSDPDSEQSVSPNHKLFESESVQGKEHVVSDTDSDITVDLQETDTTCRISNLKDPLSVKNAQKISGVINIPSTSANSSTANNIMSHLSKDACRVNETEYAHEISDTDSDTSVHLLKNKYSSKRASFAKNTGSNKRKHPSSMPDLLKTEHCRSAALRQSDQISDSDSDEVEQSKSPRGMKRVAPSDVKNKKTSEVQVIKNRSPVKADNRPMCKYGTKCYRKNPVHFREFKHPGKNKSPITNQVETGLWCLDRLSYYNVVCILNAQLLILTHF